MLAQWVLRYRNNRSDELPQCFVRQRVTTRKTAQTRGAQKPDFSHQSGMQTIPKTRDVGDLQRGVRAFLVGEPNH